MSSRAEAGSAQNKASAREATTTGFIFGIPPHPIANATRSFADPQPRINFRS
jgi:hypothetical protein